MIRVVWGEGEEPPDGVALSMRLFIFVGVVDHGEISADIVKFIAFAKSEETISAYGKKRVFVEGLRSKRM